MKRCLALVLIVGCLLTACSAKTQSLEAFYTEDGIENVDKVVSRGRGMVHATPQRLRWKLCRG